MTNPYPWLHVGEDGSVRADLQGCTGAEMDRRLVIMQEIEAGRVVFAEDVGALRDALETVASYTGDDHDILNRLAYRALDVLGRVKP